MSCAVGKLVCAARTVVGMRLSALRLPLCAGGESILEWRGGGEQSSDAEVRRENDLVLSATA
jgi:hypothetical protein